MISAATFVDPDGQTTYINPVQASWYAEYLEGLKPMTTESDFYQRLKRNMPSIHFQRIETTTQAGVFDAVWHSESSMGWIEFKIAPNDLSPQQIAWYTATKAWCPNMFLMRLLPAKKQVELTHLNTKRHWVFDEKGRSFDWSAIADKIDVYCTPFEW